MRDRPSIIPYQELVPCCGVCCIVTTLYSGYPACCGCYRQCNCLCCYYDATCLKPSNESGFCCICNSGTCMLGDCRFCCTSEDQFFCLDTYCSIPSDDRHPYLLAICFITLCYKCTPVCRCCTNIKILEGVYQERLNPPPPPVQRPIVYNYPPPKPPPTQSRGDNFAAIIQEVITEREGKGVLEDGLITTRYEPQVVEYGYVEEDEHGHEYYDDNGEEIVVENQI